MMGYYSTVFFACDRDQHELILAATEMEPDEVHSQETSDNKEIFCCEWNAVKWGYYSQADKFEDLLRDVKPEKDDRFNGIEIYPFGFVRIGEEDDDVEYIGDPYEFGIHYIRSLEWI